MKIIYCIHSTCNSGGMERVLSNKVNYLSSLPNYEIFIITTGQRGRPHFYDINPSVKCIDLDINYSETVISNPFKRIYKSFGKYLKHKNKLKEILFKLKADIVISMFTNDVNFLYKIKDGSKKVLEIHFSREFRLLANRKGITRLLDVYMTNFNDKLVAKYDRFVVLTKQDKQSWKNHKNISVIYNSVTNSDNKIVSSLENKKILAIGRLSFQKNLELLIELWSEISKIHPDWSLTIVGTGDSKELKNKIRMMNLENVINLVSSTNAINDYYINSSLYLMTSRFEGLPMVLLEAQNFGLPIVSLDCKCGPNEIITDGEDGFLIKMEDSSGFIKKTSMLIENDSMRKEFGKKAKVNSSMFSEKVIMKQWTSLFEELVN
ncbi:glycosyltransferase family 4 protein [Flavobacterium sp. LS1P3]|uniref:glycosyltransferase family 4 protein n=1 Tax=Flavobacterium sp. LS1P3 TaxID=3401720 RepID=UPI003AAE076B